MHIVQFILILDFNMKWHIHFLYIFIKLYFHFLFDNNFYYLHPFLILLNLLILKFLFNINNLYKFGGNNYIL